MWTARVDGNYYCFWRPFTLSTKVLGEVGVNRFKVGNVVNDFSSTGIRSALAENNLPCKQMFSDIGIMQKLSSWVENGETYYYTGAYSGDFTCIIKSRDLVTWEYVSQPDFPNQLEWENATYVIGDRCYYFVRQKSSCPYGFLTVYDLVNGSREKPVVVADCQSRADFIEYHGGLYLFHAPIDREHIGILRIDTDNIANSKVVLQAKMHTSCFYPFVQYYRGGELAMSYTVARQHIRLALHTRKIPVNTSCTRGFIRACNFFFRTGLFPASELGRGQTRYLSERPVEGDRILKSAFLCDFNHCKVGIPQQFDGFFYALNNQILVRRKTGDRLEG